RGGRAMSTHTAPAHPTEHAEPAEQFGVREYVHLAWQRIRGGETGILPVLGGFILVSIIFQILDQQYLTAGNLINLLVQSAVFMLLGMAEVLVLLLGEIDLSVGFVAGVSAVVLAWLAQPQVGWPWWATILAALVVTALIGLVQGSLVTRIGLPSFVVTLGGLLFWNGVMMFVLGNGGAIRIHDPVLIKISAGTLSPVLSWIVMGYIVAVWLVPMWRLYCSPRASGDLHGGEDRRGLRRRGRPHPARERRSRHPGPRVRAAVGRARGARRARGALVRARAPPLRALRVRRRRQRRGRPARRHQPR